MGRVWGFFEGAFLDTPGKGLSQYLVKALARDMDFFWLYEVFWLKKVLFIFLG